jgi:hypothetical protein
MKTFLELFAQAYLTPQEISAETHIPLETIYAMRNGTPVQERDAVRVLRVANSRLNTTTLITELDASKILWEH